MKTFEHKLEAATKALDVIGTGQLKDGPIIREGARAYSIPPRKGARCAGPVERAYLWGALVSFGLSLRAGDDALAVVINFAWSWLAVVVRVIAEVAQ